MKRVIYFFIVCILLAGFGYHIYRAVNNDVPIIYNEDTNIEKAIKLLKECEYKEPYNTIKGNNPDNKQIKVTFKNLKNIDEQYENFYALGWRIDNDLYIYINEKHKEAPVEAIAALIAGQSVHTDREISRNEEYYSFLLEGYIWKYLTKNKLITDNSDLTKREKTITAIINKNPGDGSVLINSINKIEAYKKYKQESTGYTNNEFQIKFKNLLNLYNKI